MHRLVTTRTEITSRRTRTWQSVMRAITDSPLLTVVCSASIRIRRAVRINLRQS